MNNTILMHCRPLTQIEYGIKLKYHNHYDHVIHDSKGNKEVT